MLSWENAFEEKSILSTEHFAKETERAFLKDQERILSKMLSYIPLKIPFCKLLFKKKHFVQRAFYMGMHYAMQESIFKSATKGQLSFTAVAVQLKTLN